MGVCYKSPNKTIFPDADKQLCDLINEVGGRNIVLMGDFNYPEITWHDGAGQDGGSEAGRLLIDCLDNNFLKQHVTGVTREGQPWILS